MAVKWTPTEDEIKSLKAAMAATRDKAEYQRGLCVWLRELLGLRPLRIAQALGWNRSAVVAVQMRFQRRGQCALQDLRRADSPGDGADAVNAASRRARTAQEYRRVACVRLRLVLGLTPQQVAAALGCTVAFVHEVQSDYFKSGVAAFRLNADAHSHAEGAAAELRAAVQRARSAPDLRRAQCLWMLVALNLNPKLVAQIIGWGYASVCSLYREYRLKGAAVLNNPGRGGSRARLITETQEDEMLQDLRKEKWPLGIIPFPKIHAAYEKRAGRPVKSSTVQAMLDRHGWCRDALVVTPANLPAPAGEPRPFQRVPVAPWIAP